MLVIVILGGLLGGAVYMRHTIIDWVPYSKIIFDRIGLHVEEPGAGLSIKKIPATRETIAGKEAVVVRSEIKNISDQTKRVPMILVQALGGNPDSPVLQTFEVSPEKSRLEPNQSFKFSKSIFNLIPTAQQLAHCVW